MTAGRPTKYNDDIICQSKDYLINFENNGDVIPSIEGLSEYINIARSTLYAWRDEEGKQEFSDILGQILVTQARLLINSGLKGEFNAAIAKLALGKHGYHDKQQTEVSGPDGNPIQVKDVSFTFNPVDEND